MPLLARLQNRTNEVKREKKEGDVFLLFVGVDGGCFLVAGGVTPSESELELLGEGALRLIGCAGVDVFALAGCFFVPSSDESDEDDESCFFLFTVFD